MVQHVIPFAERKTVNDLMVMDEYIISMATIEIDGAFYPIRYLSRGVQQILKKLDNTDLLNIRGLGMMKVDRVNIFIDGEAMRLWNEFSQQNNRSFKRYHIICQLLKTEG
jgi:hypothetical protein